MTSLLVISHDVVGQRMAGPGIRMWELARALAGVMPVTLIAPRPIDLLPPAGLACGHYAWGDAASLMPYLATASAVLANGYVAAAHPELLDYHGRLIIDLYDPIAFENLELFRRQPLHQRQTLAERDVTLLRLLIERGDHFLCATERQRDLYIGALLAMGRITPGIIDNDPLLQNLIMVVPFGVSDEPPQPSGQPALRGALDDLGPQHHIILWSGGLWDWMDPQTLARAMPAVLTAVPEARLVFLAGRHPGAVAEMATPVVTRQLAADLGLLGRGIHFYDDWIPYERRADFLLEAAVMVSLHREHLETRYAAVRSRVLDHFWAGKASVLSAGDAAADLIIRHQAGEVVPIGDADSVAEALIRLLLDPQRRETQSANARALGQRLRWSQVAQPVRAMLNTLGEKGHPLMTTPDRQRADTLQRVRNDAIRVQEQSWRLASPPVSNLIWQWIWKKIWLPLVSPQRDHNAAILRSVYALSEQIDYTTQSIFHLAHQIDQRIRDLERRQQELVERQQVLAERQQVLAERQQVLAERQQELAERQQELAERQQWLELRVTNLEDGVQDHNRRQVAEVHQIGQQIRDFADQLIGLETSMIQIMAHIGEVPSLPPRKEQ